VVAATAAVVAAAAGRPAPIMQVAAFSTPASPDWRWRIINYAGEIVEESHETFPTIVTAVADGTKRLVQMNVVDNSVIARVPRSTSHLRRR
jgi:hypothetical protein